MKPHDVCADRQRRPALWLAITGESWLRGQNEEGYDAKEAYSVPIGYRLRAAEALRKNKARQCHAHGLT
jgi:hypothetical protein